MLQVLVGHGDNLFLGGEQRLVVEVGLLMVQLDDELPQLGVAFDLVVLVELHGRSLEADLGRIHGVLRPIDMFLLSK